MKYPPSMSRTHTCVAIRQIGLRASYARALEGARSTLSIATTISLPYGNDSDFTFSLEDRTPSDTTSGDALRR